MEEPSYISKTIKELKKGIQNLAFGLELTAAVAGTVVGTTNCTVIAPGIIGNNEPANMSVNIHQNGGVVPVGPGVVVPGVVYSTFSSPPAVYYSSSYPYWGSYWGWGPRIDIYSGHRGHGGCSHRYGHTTYRSSPAPSCPIRRK